MDCAGFEPFARNKRETLYKAAYLVYDSLVFPFGGEEEAAVTEMNGTTKFTPVMETANDAGSILNHVYRALQAKGYDPVTQLVGYLISGDPTYITSYGQARSMICRLERDEIMEELVRVYLQGLDG